VVRTGRSQTANFDYANGHDTWLTFSSEVTSDREFVGNFYSFKAAAASALQYVYNNIDYELYDGLMKGPEATRETKAGNDWDQAALLVEMLKASGIQSEYVTRTIELPSAEVCNWIGAKDAAAAVAVLNELELAPSIVGTDIRFTHTYVQAILPGPGGLVERGMDPSIKARDYQPGIAGVLTTSCTTFNTTDFLSNPSRETPYEFYEDNVVTHLGDQSLTEIAYTGPIVAKRFDAVPALPQGYDTGTPTVSAEVDDLQQIRVRLRLYAENGNGEPVGNPLLDVTLFMPDVSLQTYELTWDKSGSYVTPVFKLGDRRYAVGTAVVANSTVQLTIEQFKPGEEIDPEVLSTHLTAYPTYFAGEHLGIGLDARQFSTQFSEAVRARIIQESLDYDAGRTTDYLSVVDDGLALAAMEYWRTLQEQANGVAALGQVLRVFNGVSNGVVESGVASNGYQAADLGISTVGNHWGLAIPFVSPTTTIDVRCASYSPFVMDSTLSSDGRDLALLAATNLLTGWNASYLESETLGRLFNADAVSTIRGLQWATQNSLQVLTLTHDGDESQLSGVSSTVYAAVAKALDDQHTVIIPKYKMAYPQASGPRWEGSVFIEDYGNGTSFSFCICGNHISNGASLADFLNFLGLGAKDAWQTLTGDPVNVATGSFTRDETDLTLPNVGVPFEFHRYYDSGETTDIGLGVGWRYSYSDTITVQGSQVTWHTDTGCAYTFTFSSGAYHNPDGLFGTLTAVGGGYTFTDLQGLARHFDSSGRLVSIHDLNGNGLDLTYQGTQLYRISEAQVPGPDWIGIQFGYDANGKIGSITDHTADATSRVWTYDYDLVASQYYLTQVLGPTGSSTETDYTYYQGGRLDGLMHTATDPIHQSTVQVEYYTNRRAFRVTDPTGNVDTFDYDFFHNVTYYTDARGNTTTEVLNSLGLTTKIIHPDRSRQTFTWDYEDQINQTTVVTHRVLAGTTDELGRTETFTYDCDAQGKVIGHLLTYLGKDGLVEVMTYYESLGRVHTITLPDDRVTTFDYDSRGNMISITDALTHVTEMTYDESRGLLTDITLPRGTETTTTEGDYTRHYTYDAEGNLLTITAGLPLTTIATYTYDGRGNPLTSMDGTDVTVTSQYDVLGRLLSRSLPDPNGQTPPVPLTTTYGWDGDEPVSITNPLGEVVRFIFDPNFMVTKAVNPDGTFRTMVYDAVGNLVRTTDELGRSTEFIYDARNRLIQTLLPDGSTVRYRHDPAGRLVSRTDGLGYVTAYGYDDGNRLTQLTDAAEQVTTYEYNANGEMRSRSGPDGDWTYTRDLLGRITQARGPAGYVTTTDYDADGNVTHQTRYDVTGLTQIPNDPRTLASGLKRDVAFDYDFLDRCVTRTDPSGHFSSTQYDAAGRVTCTTDENGNSTQYGYDAAGRLTTVTFADPDGSGPQKALTTQYTLDAAGNIVETAKVLAGESVLYGTTTYSYDVRNRQTAVTNALQGTMATLYDVAGERVATTDEMGQTTYYRYDSMGRVIDERLPDPDGAGSQQAPEITFAYDAGGNQVAVTDADEATTHYQYDGLHRVTQVTQPAPSGTGTGPTTSYEYEDNQLSSVTDPLSQVTIYHHDDAGYLTEVDSPDPDGNGTSQSPSVTSYAYDALGNLVSMTDPDQHTTTYTYDLLNRLETVTQPDPDGPNGVDAPVTTYSYDPVGNLLTREDPDGSTTNTTTYVYDAVNRVVSETDQNAGTRSYTYDAVGNLATVTDRDGRVTQYTYDALDRRTAETWYTGATVVAGVVTGGSVEKTIAYTYDADGRLATAGDGDSSYTYTRDNLGRVMQTDLTATSLMPDVSLAATYDAKGQRTSLNATVDGAADFVNTYQYDHDGRLTILEQGPAENHTNVAEKQIDFTYTASGALSTITRYSDLAAVATTTYGYDQAGRLTSIDHAQGTPALAHYGLTLDPDSQVTALTIGSTTTNYTYDADGQLKTADGTSESYTYDAAGNRTNTGDVTYADNRLHSDGTYTYTYDPEGNLVARTRIDGTETVAYAWDHRNRLTSVTYTDGQNTVTETVTYTYDVFDRRIAKTVTIGTNTTEERYVWDGQNLVLVLDGSGVTHRIVTGPVIDQVLADETASTHAVQWFLADHEGSVRDVLGLVSQTWTVVSHVTYTSFGVADASGDMPRFGFAGREFDGETGLYYNRLRYYDPRTARFLSADPSGFRGGDANLYRYVGNSPLDATDPMGLEARGQRLRGFARGLVEATVAVVIVVVVPEIGVPLLVMGVGGDVFGRAMRGERPDEVIVGTITDAVGFNGLYGLATGRDFATQEELGLDDYQLGRRGGISAIQAAVAPIAALDLAMGADGLIGSFGRLGGDRGFGEDSLPFGGEVRYGGYSGDVGSGDPAFSGEVFGLDRLPQGQMWAPDVTTAAENAPLTFYRGDEAGLTEFQSHAAQTGGQANSEAVLGNGDLNDLMLQHAIDSRNPPSPFISVTTDPNMAQLFAGPTGSVYQLDLAPGRAILNPFNPQPESEYLVPHYISPSEIKGTLP